MTQHDLQPRCLDSGDGGDVDTAHAEPAVDVDVYRRVVGRFATGVTVVTTHLDGIDHAMTANAFTSVSLEPVLVLVCVEKEARFHDAVLETGTWGVSILDESARASATWFATRGRPLHGQLDRVDHHPGPVTGAALLDAALATLEVRTTAVHDGGDHSIVVGEVVGLGTPVREGRPLLYYRGGYAHVQ
ncbi:MAG: flavin reductase family protein [Motilibacteraceae bacterium]